jgi:hypothetical protein
MFDVFRLSRRSLLTLLRSNKLFWILFGIFLIEAVWIALSGAYSMAFDEYVHYGTIQLYMHQWSPFLASQQHSADILGAVTRDPSYLYHYVMSLPLRLFAHFVHSFAAQIIFLRFFDIAFFAGGVVLFRRALQAAKLSPLNCNLTLGFFLALPVAPFMAAQVNYDDALFLLMGATILLSVQLAQSILQKQQLPLLKLLLLAALAFLASLVKYAYLPILLALAGYFMVIIYRHIGWRWRALSEVVKPGVGGLKSWRGILIAILFIISTGLFVERYGINVVRYHTPTPECNQVMSLERCLAYEPFARNYNYHQGHYDFPAWKVAVYPVNNWMRGMMRSLFFAVGNKEGGYQAGEPLPLAQIAGYIVLVGGLVLMLTRLRWLWRAGPMNRLFIIVALVYAALLFLQNFMDFMHTHVAVAIQGRYLVPILPLYLALVTQAAVAYFRTKSFRIGIAVLLVLVFMMLEGGGIVTFLIRSNDTWLWQAPAVLHANDTLRSILWPLVIGKQILIF